MRISPSGRRRRWATGLCVLLLAGAASQRLWADTTTATDPLLDLFIKKGFVTQQEAEKVEAEAQFLRTNGMANAMPPMPAESRWKISNGFKKAQLFGEVRLRYEDRSAADPAGERIDLARFRYAVRVGLRGDLYDDFYYGVRLDTGVNPRSSFVTFGTSSSGGAYQGPFGKSNAGIEVGQAYLGWHRWDWLDLELGKMPNPLYTSSLVWSGNISPEGFAERFKYPVGPAEFFANFGQFLYADFNPESASSGLDVGSILPQQPGAGLGQKTDNIFLLAWQGGVNYHITTNTSAKVAATLYHYIGLQRSTSLGESDLSPYFGDPYVGEGAYYYRGGSASGYAPGNSGYAPGTPFGIGGYNSLSFPFNQVGLDHLLVLEIPFELNFKIRRLGMDARVFGDFAYNLDGAQRARDAANAYSYILSQNTPPHGQALTNSFPAQTHDVKAYQIGLDLGSRDSLGLVNGSVSRRHGWEVKTYWQHIEQYALDPNLLDSDFFEGRENLEGIYVAAAYGLTDDLTAAFRYGHASRINDLLGTGGSNQDIPQINPINSFDIYQFELTLKF
jgi:Putative porin